jgi:5-formyltetrahydrofolate cyclo-ligase
VTPTPKSVPELKAELRRRFREQIQRLSPEDRQAASTRARARLAAQSAWQQAQLILFFAPLPDELDLWPLMDLALATGKQAALPRFSAEQAVYQVCRIQDLKRDLQIGRFGIREPKPECPAIRINRLDLLLLPGVAFDLYGRRLGRGKGYYDRLLTGVPGRRCGVAFDEQIVRELPVERHDALVNCILTPSRWLEFEPARAVLE